MEAQASLFVRSHPSKSAAPKTKVKYKIAAKHSSPSNKTTHTQDRDEDATASLDPGDSFCHQSPPGQVGRARGGQSSCHSYSRTGRGQSAPPEDDEWEEPGRQMLANHVFLGGKESHQRLDMGQQEHEESEDNMNQEEPQVRVRRTLRVRIKKSKPILGIAIEGGFNVSGQLLPRILFVHVSIHDANLASLLCPFVGLRDLVVTRQTHSPKRHTYFTYFNPLFFSIYIYLPFSLLLKEGELI